MIKVVDSGCQSPISGRANRNCRGAIGEEEALDEAAVVVQRKVDASLRNGVGEGGRQSDLVAAVGDDDRPVLADADRGGVARVDLDELLAMELVRLRRLDRGA